MAIQNPLYGKELSEGEAASGYLNKSTLGAPNGVATLDSNTKIPASQIPAITTTVGFGGGVISVPYTGNGITIPLPIDQGGTGTTTSAGAISALGAQPASPILSGITNSSSSGILIKDTNGLAQVRSIIVGTPLTITHPSGNTGNPTISLSQGHGSALDADMLDGAHGSSYLRVDGAVSYSDSTMGMIRSSINAAKVGANTDITSLANVTGLGNTSSSHLNITTAGNVLVGTTNTTANGGDVQISKGLTFPSVQVPCSNVNTLDDYKEGVWVPSIDSSTPGTGRVTLVRYAAFTKVGNLVTFSTYIDITTLGTGGSGMVVVNGLPYVCSSGQAYWGVTVPYFNSLKSSIMFVGGTVQPGTSYILLRGYSVVVTSVPALDFNTYIQVGSSFILTGFYYV